MEKEKFFEKMKEELAGRFPDITFSIREIEKAGKTYTGLGAKKDGLEPVLNLDMLYEHLSEESLETIVEKASASIRESIETLPTGIKEIQENAKDWAWAKEHLVQCAVGAEEKRDFIKDIPHRRVADIAIYYRIVLGDPSGCASSVVTNSMMELWGVTESELSASSAVEDFMFDPLGNILAQIDPTRETGDAPLYIAGYPSCRFGAGILGNNLFWDKIADAFPKGVYIIPSSIHEVLVLPYDKSMEDSINHMIQGINATEVSPEERLTGHAYVFMPETAELRIVA